MGVPVHALANAQLFKALSPQRLEEIAQLLQVEEREADDLVLQEGSPHDAMYLIKKGRVGVFGPHPKYKVSMMMEELGKGDSFGLVSLVTAPTWRPPSRPSVRARSTASIARTSTRCPSARQGSSRGWHGHSR